MDLVPGGLDIYVGHLTPPGSIEDGLPESGRMHGGEGMEPPTGQLSSGGVRVGEQPIRGEEDDPVGDGREDAFPAFHQCAKVLDLRRQLPSAPVGLPEGSARAAEGEGGGGGRGGGNHQKQRAGRAGGQEEDSGQGDRRDEPGLLWQATTRNQGLPQSHFYEQRTDPVGVMQEACVDYPAPDTGAADIYARLALAVTLTTTVAFLGWLAAQSRNARPPR